MVFRQKVYKNLYNWKKYRTFASGFHAKKARKQYFFTNFLKFRDNEEIFDGRIGSSDYYVHGKL